MPMIIKGGAYPTTIPSQGGIGQATYSVFEDFKMVGNNQSTSGSLMEVDSSFNVFRDIEFANDGGVGLQLNPGVERSTGFSLSFYNNRQAIMMADNDNETYFFSVEGLDNGQANSGTLFCYTDNCNVTTGAYPAAGTAASPTLLYPNTQGQIQVTQSVNVGFFGGDMKGNVFEAGFKFLESIGIQLNGTYIENEKDYAWGAISSGIILEGAQPKTTITGATQSVTSGGTTFYAWPIASSYWIPANYGTLADAVATYGTQVYQPYVFMPSDWNPASTAASATCPGLYQDSIERMNTTFAVTGATTQMFYAMSSSRNANGVYNSSSNPHGVPADYDWGSCTAPPTIEFAVAGDEGYGTGGFVGQGNKVELTGVHSEAIESGTSKVGGYQWVQGYGASPDYADINSGITPNAPGTGPEFYTQDGNTYDPAAATPNYLYVNPPNDIDYDPTNIFSGSILASHQLVVNINYGEINGDATFNDPFAVTPDGNEGASEHILSSQMGAFNQIIASPRAVAGTVSQVAVNAPSVHLTWDTHTGTYRHDMSYDNPYSDVSGYVNGFQFENDYNIFPTAVNESATVAAGGSGNAVGDILMVGTTGGTVAVSAISAGGVVTAVTPVTNATALGTAETTTSSGTGTGATINVTVLAAAKPDWRVHFSDGSFDVDSFNAGTQAFNNLFTVTPSAVNASVPIIASGGLTQGWFGTQPGSAATENMTQATRNVVVAAADASISYILPVCSSSTGNWEQDYWRIDGVAANTVTVTMNASKPQGGGFNGYNSIDPTSIIIPVGGRVHFTCAYGLYGPYSSVTIDNWYGGPSAYITAAVNTTNAGATATLTASTLSTNKSGVLTLTPSVAATAGTVLGTMSYVSTDRPQQTCNVAAAGFVGSAVTPSAGGADGSWTFSSTAPLVAGTVYTVPYVCN